MTTPPVEEFSDFAVVELFGHTQLAGLVRVVTLAGQPMLRIEVAGPEAGTRFVNPSAIYAITPCSEEVARAAAVIKTHVPVQVWQLPGALPALMPRFDQPEEDELEAGEDDPGNSPEEIEDRILVEGQAQERAFQERREAEDMAD